MELRRVRYKEQRTDHTTNIAWHLPIFFASLVNVAAITKVVKEVTGKQNEKWSAQITTRTKSMYIISIFHMFSCVTAGTIHDPVERCLRSAIHDPME